MRRLALLVSGASGMLLPRHLLGVLTAHPEVGTLHLVVSRGAAQVLAHELGRDKTGAEALVEAAGLTDEQRAKLTIHRDSDLDAPIASGSYRLDGTVILPCSAGTLGALATGVASTLIYRAGAVALKERTPLVLGFRETPYSILHIENMRRVTHAGAVVLPPIPAFYVGGEEMERFLDHYALRVMDRLGIREVERTGLRWREEG
jgi:4-hydroxy-3-polyprenylbenzoate decarboxylase